MVSLSEEPGLRSGYESHLCAWRIRHKKTGAPHLEPLGSWFLRSASNKDPTPVYLGLVPTSCHGSNPGEESRSPVHLVGALDMEGRLDLQGRPRDPAGSFSQLCAS